MMACIGWTWEREVRLRFHPLQMGEMAHGRLAFSWPACTGCLPLSESIEISSLHQLAGLKRPRISRNAELGRSRGALPTSSELNGFEKSAS